MEPLLSIIIPVYNVKDYLRECVDSVLSQSYTHTEIILVDDGSTDGSGAICDDYASLDSRIKIIHKENGGLSSSRNAGLDIIRGQFVTFVDSDDVIIGNNVYSDLMRKFEESPELDIVQFDVIHKYTSPEQHTRTYPFKTYSSKVDILDGYISQNIHVSCCDKIFKAEIFKRIRFPEKQISEDIAIIPQIIENTSTLEACNIGYYGYRYREGSITTSILPYWKICSILSSYSKYLKYAIKYPEVQQKALRMYSRVFWGYLSDVRTQYPDEKVNIQKLPIFISLNLSQWLKMSKGMGTKDKICSFLLCVVGIGSAFRFQSLFTRKQ